MATAARSLPEARSGSVAELSADAGPSPKTIRRLIDAGKIRGLKVGRRVLIPFEDPDRHILRMEDHRPRTQEAPAMAIAPTPTPARTGTVDPETGRILPLTEEQRRARTEALARVFAELPEADETDADETWSEVFRGIDEARPHRPLFRGMY